MQCECRCSGSVVTCGMQRVMARCRYEPIAQNGFVNLPTQLKIDDGYYGKGFYFTRFPRFDIARVRAAFALMPLPRCCRYSDYYNCGFSLATRQVEGTFLMSFTLMGRPYPVTQHPKDAVAGLMGRSCAQQPHRCCGPDSHDSHYVTVRKKGEYYPCPPREQPDFDEVVVFNPAVVLPAASFEFKRRRRTLLWLDDGPDRNAPILKQFPGCPEHKSMLAVASYPMRQHCDACKHGLMLDSNPLGTVRERQKAAKAAAAAFGAAAKAAQETPSDEAVQKEQECQRAFDLANTLVAEAQAAAENVPKEVRGGEVKLEEQVGERALRPRVCCDAGAAAGGRCAVHVRRRHGCLHATSPGAEQVSRAGVFAPRADGNTCRCSYSSSLLRIISSRKLFICDGGLQQLLDGDAAWRFKFPATFVYYGDKDADVSALAGRPNVFKSWEKEHCRAFALFKPLALMPK